MMFGLSDEFMELPSIYDVHGRDVGAVQTSYNRKQISVSD